MIAGGTGYSDSPVDNSSYVIQPTVSTPTFSPPEGAYTSAQSVSISDATSGATIYYTTNGTTPTISSTRYSGPITVSVTETLEAIAVDTGDTNSAVASAAYSITSQPDFLLSASSRSIAISPGGQAMLTLTVTPENGFDSPVTFACSGVPSGATCSFDQDTITPSAGAATSQLTISTSVQTSALRPESRPFFPLTALATIVCLFGWKERRHTVHWLALAALVFAGMGLLLGCGGGIHLSSVPASSTVTVTATSGTMQQNVKIVITVD